MVVIKEFVEDSCSQESSSNDKSQGSGCIEMNQQSSANMDAGIYLATPLIRTPSRWSSLFHRDIVYSIFYGLPVLDLNRLRDICVYWVEPIARILLERPRITPLVIRHVNRSSGRLHVSVINGNLDTILQFREIVYIDCVPKQDPLLRPLGCPMQSCHGVILLGTGEGGVHLFDTAREQALQLSCGWFASFQCVGLGYSRGQFKVVVWYTGLYDQNWSIIFTFGSPGSRDWKRLEDPPFRVMSGRAPFIQGCIHVLPATASQRMMDQIAAFNVDSEMFTKLIRFPELYYLSREPSARHLAELHNQLSVCFSLTDTLELWLLENYEDISWVKEYTIEISSFVDVPHMSSHIYADPIGFWEDGQLILNIINGLTSSQLVLYDTFRKKITCILPRNCSAVLASESTIPAQALELDTQRGVWYPICRLGRNSGRSSSSGSSSSRSSSSRSSSSRSSSSRSSSSRSSNSSSRSSIGESAIQYKPDLAISNHRMKICELSDDDSELALLRAVKRKKIDFVHSESEEGDPYKDKNPEKVAVLSTEPSSSDENVVTLLFHLPDGNSRVHSFKKSDKLEKVLLYLFAAESLKPGTYSLVRYPKDVFTVKEKMHSLADLGITSEKALFVDKIVPH